MEVYTSCLHLAFGRLSINAVSVLRFRNYTRDTRCTELLSISSFLTGLVTPFTRHVGDIRGDSSCQVRLIRLAQVHCRLVSHFYQILFPPENKYFSTIECSTFSSISSNRMFSTENSITCWLNKFNSSTLGH